ncbi:MAG: hypothetical protein ABSD98_19050, partial [Candidatus Korobacteraceae bacterium]
MKRRIFLVIWCLVAGWILTPAGRGQTAPLARQFYGTWYPYPLGNPNTASIGYEFHHNAATGKDEMTVTRTCPGEYRTTIAKAVSPIEISESTIQVLKSASGSQTGEGDLVCRVSIEANLLSYTISENGTRITITNPGGNPDLLELARQDVMGAAMVPAKLSGSWLLPPSEESDTRVQIRLVFYNSADSNNGNVRQIVSCSKGNRSLLAQADSAITMSNDQITILDSASHEERDGTFTCKATLTAETL